MPITVFATFVESQSQWGILLFWLLFLVGIPALVAWGVMTSRQRSRGRLGPQSDPEQILKVRLARGEIDSEEYEHLRGMIRADQ